MRGAVVGSIVAFALVGVGAMRVAPPDIGDNWLVQVSDIKQGLGGRTNESKADNSGQAAAEAYCTGLGSEWRIAHTDPTHGSLYCLYGSTETKTNCLDCNSYRIVVWLDGGGEPLHDPDSYPWATSAGNVYSSHTSPCANGPTTLGDPCDTFNLPTPAPTPADTFARDDPHLVGVSGDKFDVNQPGGYTLLRAPADRTLPAKLEVNASLNADGSSPCGLYIKEIQLSGAWFEGLVVRVLPLQRDMPGSNGAGNTTLRHFSLQVEGGLHGAAEVNYAPWAREFTLRLSERVHVQSLWRQSYAESGHVMEAEAFQFLIGGKNKNATSVEVSQASHQALNVEAAVLWRLGFKQFGGLLGTEGHDKQIERLTSECTAFHEMNKHSTATHRLAYQTTQPSSDERKGSTMGAYWHNA